MTRTTSVTEAYMVTYERSGSREDRSDPNNMLVAIYNNEGFRPGEEFFKELSTSWVFVVEEELSKDRAARIHGSMNAGLGYSTNNKAVLKCDLQGIKDLPTKEHANLFIEAIRRTLGNFGIKAYITTVLDDAEL